MKSPQSTYPLRLPRSVKAEVELRSAYCGNRDEAVEGVIDADARQHSRHVNLALKNHRFAARYHHSSPINLGTIMRKIQLKDAKASLSSVVNDAVRGQAAVITRHGKPEAVVLGFGEWKRLTKVPTFGRLLMSAPIKAEDLPRRKRGRLRHVKL